MYTSLDIASNENLDENRPKYAPPLCILLPFLPYIPNVIFSQIKELYLAFLILSSV